MRLPDGRPVKEVSDLGGWGGVPRHPAKLIRPERRRDLLPPPSHFIPRGMGRSYGDAALNSEGFVMLTERMDRFIAWNPETGVIRAESGLCLRDLLTVVVPQGWFLPVTPGTAFCTLGGCFAADVHGKNHHRDGSFAQHVESITLQLASGELMAVTPEDPLFWATAGGMGLTGVVVDLTLRLRRVDSSFIQVTHHPARNLLELLAMIDDPSRDDNYSVAWIDLLAKGDKLGRGILMTGHHAQASEIPLRKEPFAVPKRKARKFPITTPSWLLRPFTLRIFNALYYARHANRGKFLTDYATYFNPLDAIQEWNRAYGKAGFVQYQFVTGSEGGHELIQRVVEAIGASGAASFLAVLKKMGPGSGGWLSFPQPGYTLALDIPYRAETPDLVARLDALVTAAGGRVYLAKDSLLTAETFRQMYPRWTEFAALKSKIDPEQKLVSDLARRLEIVS